MKERKKERREREREESSGCRALTADKHEVARITSVPPPPPPFPGVPCLPLVFSAFVLAKIYSLGTEGITAASVCQQTNVQRRFTRGNRNTRGPRLAGESDSARTKWRLLQWPTLHFESGISVGRVLSSAENGNTRVKAQKALHFHKGNTDF